MIIINNIKKFFNKKKAITLYLTLGYLEENYFFEIIDLITDYEIDVLELGIPVSNPNLDGETISNTHAQSLKKGFNKEILVYYLKEIKNRYPDLTTVLMSYQSGIEKYNLLDLTYLYDGLLCPDQYLEIKSEEINIIQIYNEEMEENLIQDKLKHNQGFAYVMSGVGKTGEKGEISQNYLKTMKKIRKFSDIPIQVGFGIHSPEQIKDLFNNEVEGAIIGSEFVRKVNNHKLSIVEEYIASLTNVRNTIN